MAYDITIGSVFSGKPGYALFLYARRDQTDNANNRSSYAWQSRANFQSGTNASYVLDPITFGVTVGSDFYPSHNLDFRGGVTQIIIGSGTTGWFGHDGNGYLTVTVRTWVGNVPVFGSADTGYQQFYTDRIPKPPSQPGLPQVDSITTNSARIGISDSATDNGSGIDHYLVRWHTNSNPDVDGYSENTGPNGWRNIGPLVPGRTYYVKVYAHNGMGYSPGSPVRSFTTLSGVYIGDGGTFPGKEVLVGVDGSFQTAQIFYCESASGPYIEAK